MNIILKCMEIKEDPLEETVFASYCARHSIDSSMQNILQKCQNILYKNDGLYSCAMIYFDKHIYLADNIDNIYFREFYARIQEIYNMDMYLVRFTKNDITWTCSSIPLNLNQHLKDLLGGHINYDQVCKEYAQLNKYNKVNRCPLFYIIQTEQEMHKILYKNPNINETTRQENMKKYTKALDMLILSLQFSLKKKYNKIKFPQQPNVKKTQKKQLNKKIQKIKNKSNKS